MVAGRPGLTVDRATDLSWTICARANYEALVTTRNWSHQEYRDWLTDMLAASLPDANAEPNNLRKTQ